MSCGGSERVLRRLATWLVVSVPLFALPGCDAVLGPGFDPQRAWVAIELEGEGVARSGAVDLSAGDGIHLFAVLEGLEGDEPVYYTAAPALELEGRPVPADRLRPWPDRHLRCLWQTLDGPGAYVEVDSADRLERLAFTNFSHPDWGLECSTYATITARQRETLSIPDDAKRLAFGNQNYQVWIEELGKATDLVAQRTFRSPGVEELLADPHGFPRVHMTLAGPLEPASAVFGLTQVEPTTDLSDEAMAQLEELHRERLVFNRELLMDELLAGFSDPPGWELVELDGSTAFVDPDAGASVRGVRPGDLIRVGERIVVLFRDVGDEGVLDGQDLGFDFERGAIVRRLGEVFVGEGDVQWATPRRR